MDLKTKIKQIILDNSGVNDDFESTLDDNQLNLAVGKITELIKSTVKPSTDKGQMFICTDNSASRGGFTNGKEYKCIKDDFESSGAFIDDQGEENGWGGRNHRHFRRK